ncbi:lipoma-preferred partner [Poecile atricapillus]|uniref:lipoma-preferred partner n=1 Tax=Poecile atricapillus TaxID=48891 RepID=UPI002739800D|nr:lipoma-preferred partner [Poecile atricapillus]XP_058700319.1 lipoma-preferred partner [Poecile atricapillus]XP_058700320.1 lipoma-preferred partner [Poecile atricapillus]XP_058700321.1 lipoma-preferred partner [Poecile atricapillus]XP_058700322.1 lipoma-preferred partner [Poecile atricapillus]XP_058700323.1 lipoma-preferred partner [Poecile atricapillus]XP_058700324.1 lipoma-preferred partner [Poecile atricapillus]XP_058700325.1 lipoma-preferred partner [Poecile atricapillus]XP_05870032
MSHPSWLPPKSTNEPLGHITARMETTHTFGTPSISVSTQQTPKKFAPVVAPKPKYNPYKQPGGDGDFLPPPPPPVDDLGNITSSQGAFPPPPPLDDVTYNVQVKPGGKTLEERRCSLDAEIDSLTSILADLESSSPYKPRTQQGSGTSSSSAATTPSVSTPVTGHKRMIIPNQPPLTATKKSTAKGPGQPAPIPVTPVGTLKPQPVPASYATASTPSRPAFNVQVRTAQPSPHYQPPSPQPGHYGSLGPGQPYATAPSRQPAAPQYGAPQPHGPNYGYGPPPGRPAEPAYGYAPPQGRYQDPYYGGYGGRNGSEAPYMPQSSWKAEPAYPASNAMGQAPPGLYQPPGTKKTYITDPVLAPQVPTLQQKGGYPSAGPASGTPAFRPEDELEHLTKKMLYDMENLPSDEYFGRCARCGENVVGEGTGCTAMDQVFHVECFTCITCKSKLRGQPFYAVEKKAYCEPCYIKTLEQCSVCAKPIMERILRATGKAYHPHCFTCVMCHRSLDGIPFTVDAGGNIHCIEDFHKKFAPRCSVCKEPIMPAPGQEETVRIVALDRDFHVQCYRCEDCGGLLSEGDNQGCYPLDGHILCKTCNSARIQALTAKASTDL